MVEKIFILYITNVKAFYIESEYKKEKKLSIFLIRYPIYKSEKSLG